MAHAPVLFATIALVLAQGLPMSTPQAAVDELLAVDRGFSAAAVSTDSVSALARMFTPDVIAPGAPARLYRGLGEVTAFLRSNQDANARAEWTPVRGGVSADGQHGFTFGFMTLRRQDGTSLSLKYMSYWIKGPAGWRVAGYKRARRPEGEVSLTPMPAFLPPALVAPRTDEAWLASIRMSLTRAEQAFSDEAQRIGLGPAFAKWGAPTSVNMGGPASAAYVIGPAAIAQSVGAGPPGTRSPVAWSTDTALVASSGDLGISFGFIRPVDPPPVGTAPAVAPFFTIWSRTSPDADWRYIAE